MTSGDQQPDCLQVLTIGDGDLSFSLSLARATRKNMINIVATTYSSREEVFECYKHARPIVQELEVRGVKILHNIDATQLHTYPSLLQASRTSLSPKGGYDLIVFNYPCVGHHSLLEDQDPAAHAARHHTLLSHFFHSINQGGLLNPHPGEGGGGGGGVVSVTLCGRMPQTWGLSAAATRSRFNLQSAAPPSLKTSLLNQNHRVWKSQEELAALSDDTRSGEGEDMPTIGGARQRARRKYRGGSLGCVHWASKFGYEFRHHNNDKDMRVGNSQCFLFSFDSSSLSPPSSLVDPSLASGDCSTSTQPPASACLQPPSAQSDCSSSSREQQQVECSPEGSEGAAEQQEQERDGSLWCSVCARSFKDVEEMNRHTGGAAPDERFNAPLHICTCCRPPRTFSYLQGLKDHEAEMRVELEPSLSATQPTVNSQEVSSETNTKTKVTPGREDNSGREKKTSREINGGVRGATLQVSSAEVTVQDDQAGTRLIRFVRWNESLSRAVGSKRDCKRAFKLGEVKVNGSRAEETKVLAAGDVVCVSRDTMEVRRHREAREITLHHWRPQEGSGGGGIAVVWKERGLGSRGKQPGTLECALPWTLETESCCGWRSEEKEGDVVVHVLGALERRVPGIIIAAVGSQAFCWAKQVAKCGGLEFTFRALVRGKVEKEITSLNRTPSPSDIIQAVPSSRQPTTDPKSTAAPNEQKSRSFEDGDGSPSEHSKNIELHDEHDRIDKHEGNDENCVSEDETMDSCGIGLYSMGCHKLQSVRCRVLGTASLEEGTESGDVDGEEEVVLSKVDVTCKWETDWRGKVSDSVREFLRSCGLPVLGDNLGSHLHRQTATKGVVMACIGVHLASDPPIQVTAQEPPNFYRVQRSRALCGEDRLVDQLRDLKVE